MVTMLIREALEADGFTICAEAADADAALARALELRPDLCLLDVNMPGAGTFHGTGGIGVAAEIRSRLPGTKVVFLSVSRSDRDLVDALRAGASGFLLKSLDAQDVRVALRSVLAGNAVVPLGALARLLAERDRRSWWRRLLPAPRRVRPAASAAANVGSPPA